MGKRFRRCTKTCSQKVVLDNESLLTLILLHVPWTNLKVLKCVSRQWHSVITTSYFRSLLPPLRASGLFVQALPDTFFDISSPNKVYFVPLDDPNKASPFETCDFGKDCNDFENICILQSCNGLLLCSNASRKKWYVYNPSSNQVDSLPKHALGTGDNFRHVGLSFDPLKSLHYKVVAVVSRPRRLRYERDFYVYSSETKTWKSSVQSFISDPWMCFSNGVYWNGSMHWLSTLHRDLEPDSSVSVGLYFNVDEERLGTFPRPPIGARSRLRRSLYFGESEDHLHVIEASPCATLLSVYEMKSDYSMWFFKYRIDLDPIFRAFPEMKENTILEYQNNYAVKVFSLVRRENFHEDSFLVLEIPGKVIRYNLMDRSSELICDFGVDLDLDPNINDDSLIDFQVCQYIESLS